MKEKRVKIGAAQSVPLIREMITDTAIKEVLDEPCQWLVIKARRDKMKPYQADKLNLATSILAERLAGVHIAYSTDRQAVIDQIKEHLRPVKLKYIYGKHLGHNTVWWTYRTRRPYGNDYCYTLTEDEVLRINLAIEDIVSRLRRIEVVVE